WARAIGHRPARAIPLLVPLLLPEYHLPVASVSAGGGVDLGTGALMRNASRRGAGSGPELRLPIRPVILLVATLIALVGAGPALAQNSRVEELASAVVRVKTHINPEGRTVEG